MRRLLSLALVATFVVSVAGFGVDLSTLGTRDNPIIWKFVPSNEPGYLKGVADQIAEDISEMTGLYILAMVTVDYRAFIEDFVAAEGNIMGAPATAQYVEIADRTNFGVTPRLGSVRYGFPYYYTGVYTLREYGYTSIYDLQGKIWAYPSESSASGYKIPKGLFDAAGISFGGALPSGDSSHQRALLNVLDRQADFSTGFWNPGQPPAYLLSAMKAQPGYINYWFDGWDPELWIWDYYNNALYPEQIRGTVEDLRESVGDMYATGGHTYGDKWALAQTVQVLDLFGPIPNDCLAFCAGFPQALQDQIVAAIQTHIGSSENKGPGWSLWADSKFYKWTDVQVIDDSFYNEYRLATGYRLNQ